MYASSRVREVEHRSASACAFVHTSTTLADDEWLESNDDNGVESTPVVQLQEGTVIRVAPMERKCGGWSKEHFNDNCRLPEGSAVGRGMVVTLEAMARECVAVALAPTSNFILGKTYAVHIGASSNFSTVIRRRLPNSTEAVDVTIPSPRICSDKKYIPYWIILQMCGTLSVGVGTIPGKNCIGSLDDGFYHQLRSGVDAVRYVGIGNSAIGRQLRDLRVRKVRVMSIPNCFGDNGIPLSDYSLIGHSNDWMDGGKEEKGDNVLWAEYEKECAKAKARAAKFGTEYKQPGPDAFFKWSEARRLRANPEKGFITGIDIMSSEEQAKAKKRKERFNEEEDVNDGANCAMEDEYHKYEEERTNGTRETQPLPLEQAWDNEEFVRAHRRDPPTNLYMTNSLVEGLGASSTIDGEYLGTENEEAINESIAFAVQKKVHVFAIDWAAFKQIRTDDILAYFSAYGPTYVEWLGELSCNVLFEDKFSAARALAALSQELPTPTPKSVLVTDSKRYKVDLPEAGSTVEREGCLLRNIPDFGAMGWRFCNFPVQKIVNDQYGKKGTVSRLLMRVACSLDVLDERPMSWPRPPPGFTTKKRLGPGSDFMQHYEFGDERVRTKKRRKGDRGHKFDRYTVEEYGDYDENDEDHKAASVSDQADYEHPALSQGLRAGRAGFTVEEVKAQREAKKSAGVVSSSVTLQ